MTEVAAIPIGFWAFWLVVGLVLYVAFAWTLIRLAVRSDETRDDDVPEREHAPKELTDETEGSRA